MKILTESEVFSIALNRNVSVGLLKPSQISVAEQTWFRQWVSDEFYFDIVDNEDDYLDFIEDFVKPIVAWGAIYNNYEYITVNITDKGLIQLLVEGTASLLNRDSKLDAKFEIKNTAYQLIKKMFAYCKAEKADNNPLFANFAPSNIEPAIVTFYGRERLNQIPY